MKICIISGGAYSLFKDLIALIKAALIGAEHTVVLSGKGVAGRIKRFII